MGHKEREEQRKLKGVQPPLLVRVCYLCEPSLRSAVCDVYSSDSGLQWVYDLLVSLMYYLLTGKHTFGGGRYSVGNAR